MGTEVYYKIYRQIRGDWVEYVNRCHKWTQTNTNRSHAIAKAWLCSSELLLQAEINRVVELYKLTGSRDLNTKKAIADVINHQYYLQDNKKVRDILQRKIGRTITHKKYYNKKKNDMKQIKTKAETLDTKEIGESIQNDNDNDKTM